MTPLQEPYFNLKDGLTIKKASKQLHLIASLLPMTVYVGKKVHKVIIHDLTEKEVKNSMFPEIGQQPIISGNVEQLRKSEAYFYANNKRRLKTAYKTKGKKGVLEYIKWVNDNNKAVSSAHETTKAMGVISEVLKAKIEPFL